MALVSLPIRGAWIEIPTTCATLAARSRRSPSGERGLKSRPRWGIRGLRGSLPIRGAWIEMLRSHPTGRIRRSLPIRGAWIEITIRVRGRPSRRSLPIRGAWIEIRSCTGDVSVSGGRSPSGERGLKFEPAVGRIVVVGQVAPHPGSVD